MSGSICEVTALGTNARLNECYLLNCDITQANAGGSTTITAIKVGASSVTVTVELDRTAGYTGGINGTLKLFGKADQATGDFADTSATIGDAKFSSDTTITDRQRRHGQVLQGRHRVRHILAQGATRQRVAPFFGIII